MQSERILVTRSSMPPFDEYVSEIEGIWETRWLSNYGVKYNELCDALCDYLDVPNMCLFTNGHLALEAAIAAFDLSGEVITTPFTFGSTTHAIVRNGLVPVFCDIDPYTYCIDPEKLEGLITDKTSAIVGVHVYGNLCDVDAIRGIADEHGLKVIYDGAHAFGVSKGGVGAGNFGDATMFSFHATKVFHTIEGGGVAYRDPGLGEALRRLQNFGYDGGEEVTLSGGNAKMSEFQAAMGLCNLRHVDDYIRARKSVAEEYRSLLGGIEGLDLLGMDECLKPNYAYFPAVFDPGVFEGGRDGVAEKLEREGINARKYFYPLTCDYECYRGRYRGDVPVARDIASRVLALPLYEGLALEDVRRICGIISRQKRER